MKILCFKFQQNQTINEEFYFWKAKYFPRSSPMGGRVARFQKIEKSLCRTMVSTHSQNFTILAELESVLKLGTF